MIPIKYRVWTGKKMMYQDKQYLASFICRVVLQICLDHGCAQQHESYLPNGGVIDEYLQLFTGLCDKGSKEGYADDLVRMYDYTVYQIVWNDYYARFELQLTKGDEYYKQYSKVQNMGMLQFGEIIGNIHEGPKSLKEGKR